MPSLTQEQILSSAVDHEANIIKYWSFVFENNNTDRQGKIRALQSVLIHNRAITVAVEAVLRKVKGEPVL